MTDRQIADAGIDRRTFPLDAMQQIEAEFAQKDASQAKANICKSGPSNSLRGQKSD